MPRRLYRQERLDVTLKMLRKTGYVSVSELSDSFDVSTVTIRSDLDLLERSGHLLRTHGGAVPISMGEGVLSFSVRQRTNVQAKERIGAAAAELVSDGEAIVLDASTTGWHMARFLLARHDLTVLTTGLYVALELLRAPGISVIMPGGRIWREAAAVVGTAGQRPAEYPMMEMGNLHQGFFSGRGFSMADGLTDANSEEVQLKRHMVDSVRVVNAIIDSSKLDKVAFATCASIDQIQRVITNRDAAERLVSSLRDRGIEVILA